MAILPNDIQELIARLAPETRRQRQSALLRPLNNSLIVITSLAAVLALLGTPNVSGLLIMGASLLINLGVVWLDWRGHTRAAAYLFSIWVNTGILIIFLCNLFLDQNLGLGVLFACQLALSVTLVGLLLGIPYAGLFTLINIGVVCAALYRYTAISGTTTTPWAEVLSFGVPVSSFLILTVVITWLYQRALRQAETNIEAARKRIMQDQLMRRDVAVARELQLRLFPPPPLTNDLLRIASRSEPARETSGDFYDFINLGEGLLGIVVADVTGKSVAAALMMALARVTIRSEARRHSSPSEVLRAANETINRDHTARQLITTFYGVLDTRRLTLRFANAGHPYPLLRRGDLIHEIEIVGMPLGGRPDTVYAEFALQLEPGDQLYLISDGLVEERNARREMFGYGRLTPAIIAAHPDDPEQAIDELWQAVSHWRGEVEQADDITLVVIQALAVPEGATKDAAPAQPAQFTR